MEVKKIDSGTGSVFAAGFTAKKTRKTGSLFTTGDVVEISKTGGAKSTLFAAKRAMGDFKTALSDTLKGYDPSAGLDSLYSLTGTPVEGFIRDAFSNLPSDTRTSFVDLFNELKMRQGGLVPQSLVDQTFGGSGGFGTLIASIGQRLGAVK